MDHRFFSVECSVFIWLADYFADHQVIEAANDPNEKSSRKFTQMAIADPMDIRYDQLILKKINRI
jgi:hypothetical protein